MPSVHSGLDSLNPEPPGHDFSTRLRLAASVRHAANRVFPCCETGSFKELTDEKAYVVDYCSGSVAGKHVILIPFFAIVTAYTDSGKV
jgi:hypothetical protein